MRLRRKHRKQRVVLRARHRRQLHDQVRTAAIRAAIVSGVAMVGFVLFVYNGGLLFRLLESHTPRVEIRTAAVLGAIPVAPEIPRNTFLMWLPGAESRLENRLQRKFAIVKSVNLERRFRDNIVVARVDARTPLVHWDKNGLDGEGVVFPLGTAEWTRMPKALLVSPTPKTVIGRWLAELSKSSTFWPQVVAVTDDRRGTMRLHLQTGAQIIWGPPEVQSVREKAGSVARVLEDAHEHLGGAAIADLRFFSEGRIIVRPKGVKS